MDGIKIDREESPGTGASTNIFQRLIFALFRPMTKGRLNMILPDGQSVWFGQGQDCPPAVIRVIDNAFFCKCVLFGDVGFAESYMDGDWETANIKAVIEWMIRNLEQHPTLMADTSKYKPVNFFKFLNDLYHVWRPNTVAGSRSNIEKHYDLGNDFFRLFLDPGMTYSSACFSSDDDSLEQAQANKYERLCQKLRLKHTDHVLEIGCGWGGFALYAARNYGCRVTGVTISKEQHDYALRRVEREGMSGRVRVILEDYRSVKGRYDKIVSIEMIEAVGHEFYGSFFSQCHRLLKQEGLLAMQMILSPDHRYQSFRRTTDFIQKHIFPGSLLPSFPVLHRAVNGTGTMCLYDYEDITPHYVRTLMLWQERFRQNRQAVQDLGFSRQFLRKWEYYFEYCAAAFEMRNISVAQAVFTRPNNLGLGRPYALH